MLKLYYSGANSFLGSQPSPDKSLGGYVSSSPIPNASLNNLFTSVSERARKEEFTETKAFFLKNETGATVTNVRMYANYAVNDVGNNVVKFEFAAVTLVNDQKIESIPSTKSSPFSGNFVEAEGISNEVVLTSSLLSDKYIGIWVKRIVLPKTPVDCNDLEQELIDQKKIEETDFVISWD